MHADVLNFSGDSLLWVAICAFLLGSMLSASYNRKGEIEQQPLKTKQASNLEASTLHAFYFQQEIGEYMQLSGTLIVEGRRLFVGNPIHVNILILVPMHAATSARLMVHCQRVSQKPRSTILLQKHSPPSAAFSQSSAATYLEHKLRKVPLCCSSRAMQHHSLPA